MKTINEDLNDIVAACGPDMTLNDYACAAAAMLFVIEQASLAFDAFNAASTNKTIPVEQMLVALARVNHIFQALDK